MSQININFNQTGCPYNPFWKKCICAGRAAEGLREDWRNQLREVQKEIGFEYIRFHGIFHDEMMIYNEKKDGTVYYNWQYFDNLFDFLQEVRIHPILELGFMPSALASGAKTTFWWKGNITPPKDYSKWHRLVQELIRHCINRYGLTEVLKWYFEVWNEPNLDCFWSGTQEEYFKLYEYSVSAVKSIDNRLKVGGPASSNFDQGKAPWVEEFLSHCKKNNLPVDFISTHPYPSCWPREHDGNNVVANLNDPEYIEWIFNTMGYRDENSVYNDLEWIHKTIKGSSYKHAEIHLTEWNSSSAPKDLVHDTAFMAPFIIQNNIRCLGLADSLGFWTFTDICEELAAGETIFHGGFGLINLQGLKKPSYYGYWFLSRLGNEKLGFGDNYFVARKDDKLQILIWNYCHYNNSISSGDRKALSQYDRYSIFNDKDILTSLFIEGLDGDYKVISYVFGRENGSVFDTWISNDAPPEPTAEELGILMKKTGPEGRIKFINGVKTFNQEVLLKPHDVVLIELQKISCREG